MTRRGLVLFGLMSIIWGVGFVLVIVGSALATRGCGSEAAVAAPEGTEGT